MSISGGGNLDGAKANDTATARSGKLVSSRFVPYFEGSPKRGRTADMVAHVLREAILDGVLEPACWLRELELAQELSVSRTPIRDALKRLSVEGLVVLTAGQGAMVAPLTIEDILQVYVVRENLEGLAARLAAKHGTRQDLERLEEVSDRMRRSVAEGRLSDLARLNIEFHKAIREAADNRYLDRFLTQVEHEVRRFGRTTFEFPGRADEALAEHTRIVEAIARGDTEVAERLAIEHMRNARELRVRMLVDG